MTGRRLALAAVAALLAVGPTPTPMAALDGVPIDCDPAVDCPAVDPCKLNPDKCQPPAKPCHTECQWGYIDGVRCQKCCAICGGERMECDVSQCEQ